MARARGGAAPRQDRGLHRHGLGVRPVLASCQAGSIADLRGGRIYAVLGDLDRPAA